MRVGIAGKRGKEFVAGLRAVPGVEVVALCEADAAVREKMASEQARPQTFADFEAMLDVVDAVVIGTPMHLHVPQSVLALQAGKHVLSEVTAAVSLEECWQLREAVEQTGGVYMMAENYCYFRDNVLIREMARKGLFGELYYGEGEYLHEVRSLHHHADGSPTWRHTWQVGRRGTTYGTHSLGPVMQWFKAVDPNEKIASVVCMGTGPRTDPEHPQDDTSLMLCQLASGKLIKVRLDMMSNRPHAVYYALQGTTGAFEASRAPGQPAHVWLGENKMGEDRKWEPLKNFEAHLPEAWRNPSEEEKRAGHGGGDFHIGRAFGRAIQEGTPVPIDLYDALEWTAAGLCAQQSIVQGGVPVAVPDFRLPRPDPA